MYFFKSFVISKKIQLSKYLKIKAFFASLLIHATLLATSLYLLESPQEVELPKEPSTVVVSLSAYKPMAEPKKVEPLTKKEVEKELDKPHKKVVKKAPLAKQTPVTPAKTLQKIPTPLKQELISSEAFTPHASNETSTQEPTQDNSFSPKKIQPDLSKSQITPTTLGVIRALIQNALVYPAVAKKLKLEGVVIISFVLTKDGQVESAFIHTKSGSDSLDSKALKTVVALSGEYPHLDKKVDLKIPISFSLQKS